MSESKARMREERDFAIQLWGRAKSALETILELGDGEADEATVRAIRNVAGEALKPLPATDAESAPST